MLAKSEAANRVGQLVRDTISDLLDEQGLENPGVEDDAKLVDTLGLKSMDIAQVVLVLEDELDADPFQEIPITSVRTVGDLINAYRVALEPEAGSGDESSSTSPSTTATTPSAPRRANRRR